jgi:hypothetical protein
MSTDSKSREMKEQTAVITNGVHLTDDEHNHWR